MTLPVIKWKINGDTENMKKLQIRERERECFKAGEKKHDKLASQLIFKIAKTLASWCGISLVLEFSNSARMEPGC